MDLNNIIEKQITHKLEVPEHEEVKKDTFQCLVVAGKGQDLIFQFFGVKAIEFPNIIAEVIEDHFGDTNNFAIEYVRELDMYGLLAKNIKQNPLFSREFHIIRFLDLLDKTIINIQK